MQARSLLVSLTFCAAFGRTTFAQTSQPASPYGADVTADDVYVRSGPGSNYYPTTKLHAGDRVLVVGEQFGWLKIAPPPGSFSYVDMTLVEKTGASGAKDMGKVIASLKADYPGRIDFGKAAGKVKAALAG